MLSETEGLGGLIPVAKVIAVLLFLFSDKDWKESTETSVVVSRFCKPGGSVLGPAVSVLESCVPVVCGGYVAHGLGLVWFFVDCDLFSKKKQEK